MDKKLEHELRRFALEIRIGALTAMRSDGAGHAGGALSIADALACLYGGIMRIDPNNPKWPERDKLVSSKGHAGPAIYAALACKGYFPKEWLTTLNKPKTNLPSHCDRNRTPGIDMTTGSLGQGTSLACGMALGEKLRKSPSRIYLIVGDGELNEGQPWEAFAFAAARKLDNLTLLLDYNKRQLDGYVGDILDPGDFVKKLDAFGFAARMVPGNDIAAVYAALKSVQGIRGKPQAIVLDTTKGAGVQELEDMTFNHHVSVPEATWTKWIAGLQAELAAL